jgi:ABC-type glycerol-3-phosphate transport system substrate-binding protein
MLDDKTFTESNRKFIETQAAYEIIWSSIFLNDKNENTAVTAIPGFNEINSDIATGWVLAIPQSSGKELGGALDLMKFFTDPLFQGRWSEAAGYIPISREALSGWSDQQVSGILMDIAAISQVLPDRDILEEVGPLFTEATQDLLKQQVSYIQASNTILSRISE